MGPRIFGHQSLETKLATEILVAKSIAENVVTKIRNQISDQTFIKNWWLNR